MIVKNLMMNLVNALVNHQFVNLTLGNQMKTVKLISAPSTEYEVIKETSIYAPSDKVYVMLEGELEFARTQTQSEAYIKQLEARINTLEEHLEYWSYVPNF